MAAAVALSAQGRGPGDLAELRAGVVATISLDGLFDECRYVRGTVERWFSGGQGVLAFDPPAPDGRSAVAFYADAVRAIDDVPLSPLGRACLCIATLGVPC